MTQNIPRLVRQRGCGTRTDGSRRDQDQDQYRIRTRTRTRTSTGSVQDQDQYQDRLLVTYDTSPGHRRLEGTPGFGLFSFTQVQVTVSIW